MKIDYILKIAAWICLFGFAVCCEKNSEIESKPQILTKPVQDICSSSVISGGELTSEIEITDKGLIWGTDSTFLTISNTNKISSGSGSSNFMDTIQNLLPSTTYYLRAYAIYNGGAVYGAILKFNTLEPQPIVYLAGYNGSTAAYWKNGKLFSLPNGTYAHSVYATDNDVYIAGEYNDGNLRAVYWKNGTANFLTDGSHAALANSIWAVGDDVYIAGYELLNEDDESPMAKYWKNDVEVLLTSGNDDFGIAYSICVVEGNIYTAGFKHNPYQGITANYWQNSNSVPLNDALSSVAYAQSIFVMDNDIYVAGNVRLGLGLAEVPIATYWKNTNPVFLTNGDDYAGAYSIFVSGSDVYVAGYENDGSTGYSVAKYWKNGIPYSLTDGSKYAGAQSIYVVDNDVYIAGWESDELGYYRKAKYWKNGVSQPLEISSDFSSAVSIYVK